MPHYIYLGYLIINGEEIDIYVAIAGAKRAVAVTRALETHRGNEFCVTFEGFACLVYSAALYKCPDTVKHLIKENNSRNLLTCGVN